MSNRCLFFEKIADTHVLKWLLHRKRWDEENDLQHRNQNNGSRTFSSPPDPVELSRPIFAHDLPDTRDSEAADSFDLPEECPHEPVADGLCQFHLPIDHPEKDLDTLSSRIAHKISSGSPEDRNFWGAILPELDLSKQTFHKSSTEPIDLRFAWVDGDINLAGANVHQELFLDYTICDGFDAGDAVFHRILSAENLIVYGDLTLARCTQHTVLSFNNSIISGSVLGQNAVHAGRFGLANVIVVNNLNLSRTKFERAAVFTGSRFGGKAEFERTEFSETMFGSGKIGSGETFPGATFFNSAIFTNAEWTDIANFSEVDFFSYTKFDECVFHKNARFVQLWSTDGFFVFDCEFHHFARFEQSLFQGPTRFLRPSFARRFDLSDSIFTGAAEFSHIQIDDPVSLAIDDATVHGPVSISHSYSIHNIHVTESNFESSVTLDELTVINRLSMIECEIADLSAERVQSPRDVRLEGTQITSGRIDCRYIESTATTADRDDHNESNKPIPAESTAKSLFSTTISSGVQNVIYREWAEPMSEWLPDGKAPDEPLEVIPTYDVSNGTFGDIEILHNENTSQRQIRFYRTRFDNFRFDTHSDFFSPSWIIHTYKHDRPDAERSPNVLFFTSLLEWPENPDALRVTYLDAREGATQIGANDAASKLYRHEKRYKRKLLFQNFAGGSIKSRFHNGIRWISNWLLNLSSGYGERPGYTVIFSLGLIAAFSIAYRRWDKLLDGSTTVQVPVLAGEIRIPEYIVFSFQAFVNFLPGPPLENIPISLRLFSSLETLMGAFVIALFVFTLTRALRR